MSIQPMLFVSHGSPMLALDRKHPYAQALESFARALPERPKAVLAVSAHWQSAEPRVSSRARPGILHDFQGFPEALYELDYPALGDPELAARAAGLLRAADLEATEDPGRPLDHGVWAVLRHLFPAADLPVVQVSLPRWEPRRLLALGAALGPLRREGVLLLASGGLVHNLGAVDFGAPDGAADPWALEAEAWIMERLAQGRREDLLEHRERWPRSRRAAPTNEHLDPLFVALGAAVDAAPRTVFEGWQLANMSLRTLAWA